MKRNAIVIQVDAFLLEKTPVLCMC